MRVLIVDDEPAARRRLAIMLDELDVEVVGEAANGVEALTEIERQRPDVLLLDIAMPEVNGLDVARHLSDPKPWIIFQTAYDEFALKAFEHEALDYVVKPVTMARLTSALDRARRRLEGRGERGLTDDLVAKLQSAVASSDAPAPRVLVRDGRGHRLLPYREISRFTVGEGITWAHTPTTRFPTHYTLSELEGRTGRRFVRTSRADLVNVEWVERIESNGDGSATLTLRDATPITVARRRAAQVRHALE